MRAEKMMKFSKLEILSDMDVLKLKNSHELEDLVEFSYEVGLDALNEMKKIKEVFPEVIEKSEKSQHTNGSGSSNRWQ